MSEVTTMTTMHAQTQIICICKYIARVCARTNYNDDSHDLLSLYTSIWVGGMSEVTTMTTLHAQTQIDQLCVECADM